MRKTIATVMILADEPTVTVNNIEVAQFIYLNC
jgi:hypothetical protein